MNVEKILNSMPEPVRDKAFEAVDSIKKCFHDASKEKLLSKTLVEELKKINALSEFLAGIAKSRPFIFLDLIDSGDFDRTYSKEDYLITVKKALEEETEFDELGKKLRLVRTREMVRIAWRDLASRAMVEETLLDLTHLAEACLDESLKRLHLTQAEKMGFPVDSSGKKLQLVVLGMGKLGGRELNFSSDIDLILCYDQDGYTNLGTEYTNNQFFTALAQSLLKLIGAATPEGFVFRTDTRLRPFGEQGPLVISFDAMEEYYETHGREWERYALVKARPVAGDIEAGKRLLERLKPFIYRKYLDFTAFESLRKMKLMIEKEHGEAALKDDLKLGPGGIRDIEFICQALQLLYGGRFTELQVPGTLKAMQAISELNLYPADELSTLKDSYHFLRLAENHVQEIRDAQTHTLPKPDTDKLRLAFSMNYPSWPAFEQKLRHKMAEVSKQFKTFLSMHEPEEAIDTDLTFSKELNEKEWLPLLKTWGLKQPDAIFRLLRDFWTSRSTQSLGPAATDRLQRLLPKVIKEASKTEFPEQAIARMLDILDAIKGRAVYLSLLLENDAALKNLVFLSSKCPWIAKHVARYPVVLDELLDHRLLFSPDSKETLGKNLEAILKRIPEDDLESQMEELRRFRHGAVLRVAAADITGALSILEVGSHLTDIAEVIVEQALKIAFLHMKKRHGLPEGVSEQNLTPGFIVIGYGKFGSREMGYGSDLDLVFLHSAKRGTMTNGPKKIEASLFYARLGQRLLHILTAYTPFGRLYEVDMRLRPEGESGILVSSIEAFYQYEMEAAWTWEHQALVRARPVCGDPALKTRFSSFRKEILCKKRDIEELRNQVISMRKKIIAQKSKEKQNLDIKYQHGGLIDIEFLTQFLVLANAYKVPALCDYTGTVSLLKVLADNTVIKTDQAKWLIEGFKLFLKTLNEKRLTGKITEHMAEDCLKLFEKVAQLRKELLKW